MWQEIANWDRDWNNFLSINYQRCNFSFRCEQNKIYQTKLEISLFFRIFLRGIKQKLFCLPSDIPSCSFIVSHFDGVGERSLPGPFPPEAAWYVLGVLKTKLFACYKGKWIWSRNSSRSCKRFWVTKVWLKLEILLVLTESMQDVLLLAF